jgi:hypothetical protein
VKARGWAILLLVLLVAAWGGAGYLMTKPTDYHDYRVAAVQSAQSAYNSVATVSVTGAAKLDGRVFAPYLSTVLDNARKALAGAAKQFTDQAPPDAATAAIRDQLGPLLLAANSTVGDVERAAADRDDQAMRQALRSLDPVSDDLSKFIEDHR